MIFHTAYNLDFEQDEKGLIECEVTITSSFFKRVSSVEKFTMIFLGQYWVDKNTMATINDNYLINIATNSYIYHCANNETNVTKEQQ